MEISKFFVIDKQSFSKFRVRNVKDNIVLVIGFCIKDPSGDWYCANIIKESSSLHRILFYVREVKKLNNNKANRKGDWYLNYEATTTTTSPTSST